MSKKLNEAAVSLDIAGLESGDFETLSQILHLAGVAEKPAQDVQDVQPDMGMDMAAPEPEDEFGLEQDIPDAMDEPEPEADITLGLDGSPELAPEDEFAEPEEELPFDMGRLRTLSGIGESVQEDEEVLESLLPDLTLGEDATEERDLEFGPFSTEDECVANAEEKTNGVEGDNFIVVLHANKYYWRRTVQEDAEFRPEGDVYDTDGIVHSRHEYERVPGTAPGNNGLKNRVNEEQCDDEESVESLHESLVARYRKYIGE